MDWIGATSKGDSIAVNLATLCVIESHSIVMERSKDTTTADWESHWASVTFAIPAK